MRAVAEETSFVAKGFPACSDARPEETHRTRAWGSQVAESYQLKIIVKRFLPVKDTKGGIQIH